MTPESVGRELSAIVLGRHSGLHGVKNRLSQLGFILEEDQVKAIYEQFLEVADKKKEVFDEDLITLVNTFLEIPTSIYTLDYFNIISGNRSVPTATIRIGADGKLYEEAATGNGPIDAIFRAIDRVTGISATLLEYSVNAVTSGKQAMGEAGITLEIGGIPYVGKGASTDILEASGKAYLNALNRYKILKEAEGKARCQKK
ncbi:MAG: 2-isopropylmalate synthase, partial [Spirochaetales bacterium]|jgi:2-isopropylmalate synthase|nr:2-isopropylmalate synthase [Spirochaetales bacterium]